LIWNDIRTTPKVSVADPARVTGDERKYSWSGVGDEIPTV
jgi:hypothetical protein